MYVCKPLTTEEWRQAREYAKSIPKFKNYSDSELDNLLREYQSVQGDRMTAQWQRETLLKFHKEFEKKVEEWMKQNEGNYNITEWRTIQDEYGAIFFKSERQKMNLFERLDSKFNFEAFLKFADHPIVQRFAKRMGIIIPEWVDESDPRLLKRSELETYSLSLSQEISHLTAEEKRIKTEQETGKTIYDEDVRLNQNINDIFKFEKSNEEMNRFRMFEANLYNNENLEERDKSLETTTNERSNKLIENIDKLIHVDFNKYNGQNEISLSDIKWDFDNVKEMIKKGLLEVKPGAEIIFENKKDFDNFFFKKDRKNSIKIRKELESELEKIKVKKENLIKEKQLRQVGSEFKHNKEKVSLHLKYEKINNDIKELEVSINILENDIKDQKEKMISIKSNAKETKYTESQAKEIIKKENYKKEKQIDKLFEDAKKNGEEFVDGQKIAKITSDYIESVKDAFASLKPNEKLRETKTIIDKYNSHLEEYKSKLKESKDIIKNEYTSKSIKENYEEYKKSLIKQDDTSSFDKRINDLIEQENKIKESLKNKNKISLNEFDNIKKIISLSEKFGKIKLNNNEMLQQQHIDSVKKMSMDVAATLEASKKDEESLKNKKTKRNPANEVVAKIHNGKFLAVNNDEESVFKYFEDNYDQVVDANNQVYYVDKSGKEVTQYDIENKVKELLLSKYGEKQEYKTIKTINLDDINSLNVPLNISKILINAHAKWLDFYSLKDRIEDQKGDLIEDSIKINDLTKKMKNNYSDLNDTNLRNELSKLYENNLQSISVYNEAQVKSTLVAMQHYVENSEVNNEFEWQKFAETISNQTKNSFVIESTSWSFEKQQQQKYKNFKNGNDIYFETDPVNRTIYMKEISGAVEYTGGIGKKGEKLKDRFSIKENILASWNIDNRPNPRFENIKKRSIRITEKNGLNKTGFESKLNKINLNDLLSHVQKQFQKRYENFINNTNKLSELYEKMYSGDIAMFEEQAPQLLETETVYKPKLESDANKQKEVIGKFFLADRTINNLLSKFNMSKKTDFLLSKKESLNNSYESKSYKVATIRNTTRGKEINFINDENGYDGSSSTSTMLMYKDKKTGDLNVSFSVNGGQKTNKIVIEQNDPLYNKYDFVFNYNAKGTSLGEDQIKASEAWAKKYNKEMTDKVKSTLYHEISKNIKTTGKEGIKVLKDLMIEKQKSEDKRNGTNYSVNKNIESLFDFIEQNKYINDVNNAVEILEKVSKVFTGRFNAIEKMTPETIEASKLLIDAIAKEKVSAVKLMAKDILKKTGVDVSRWVMDGERPHDEQWVWNKIAPYSDNLKQIKKELDITNFSIKRNEKLVEEAKSKMNFEKAKTLRSSIEKSKQKMYNLLKEKGKNELMIQHIYSAGTPERLAYLQKAFNNKVESGTYEYGKSVFKPSKEGKELFWVDGAEKYGDSNIHNFGWSEYNEESIARTGFAQEDIDYKDTSIGEIPTVKTVVDLFDYQSEGEYSNELNAFLESDNFQTRLDEEIKNEKLDENSEDYQNKLDIIKMNLIDKFDDEWVDDWNSNHDAEYQIDENYVEEQKNKYKVDGVFTEEDIINNRIESVEGATPITYSEILERNGELINSLEDLKVEDNRTWGMVVNELDHITKSKINPKDIETWTFENPVNKSDYYDQEEIEHGKFPRSKHEPLFKTSAEILSLNQPFINSEYSRSERENIENAIWSDDPASPINEETINNTKYEC